MTRFADEVSKLSKQRLALLCVELQRELGARRQSRAEPIAVIGIGCRLPGGVNGPEEFWSLLRDGVDAIGPIPADRWDVDAYYDPDADGAREDVHARRRVPRARGRVRPGVLRDLAARGPEHGPAAPPAAGGRLGGPRARRPARRAAGGQPDRRVRGDRHLRLRHLAGQRTSHASIRRVHGHRQCLLLRVGAPGLPAGLPRPQPGRRHRLLHLARDGPPGLPEPARGRVHAGPGRRCEPDALARADDLPRRRPRRSRPTGAARLSTPRPTATAAAKGAASSC